MIKSKQFEQYLNQHKFKSLYTIPALSSRYFSQSRQLCFCFTTIFATRLLHSLQTQFTPLQKKAKGLNREANFIFFLSQLYTAYKYTGRIFLKLDIHYHRYLVIQFFFHFDFFNGHKQIQIFYVRCTVFIFFFNFSNQGHKD